MSQPAQAAAIVIPGQYTPTGPVLAPQAAPVRQLIKIDGKAPTPLGKLAPRCWNCVNHEVIVGGRRMKRTKRVVAGRVTWTLRPYSVRGIPVFAGLAKRKADGKVFTCWRCGECGQMSFFYEPNTRKIDLDRPGAVIVDETLYPQLTHAIGKERNW